MEERKLLFGNGLQDGYQKIEEGYSVIYYDQLEPDNIYFTLTPSVLSRHILLLGGAGCGKTTAINLTLEQLKRNSTDNDVFIIFDTKEDYYKDFHSESDYVIGNGKTSRDISQRWNIFDEVLADGDDPSDYEVNAREIAAALFEGRGSTSQPFFSNAARDIFAKTIIYFIRRAKEDPENRGKLLNNKNLVDFCLNKLENKFSTIFNYYHDMKGVLSYVGDGSSNQALGVFAELHSMLNDLFLGVFNEDDSKGRFSIREAVRGKKGKSIFIEYDIKTGETLTPIYRLLVDLALKEALGRSDKEKGNVYLILDELKLLPKLKHFDDALNFGRSLGVKVIAGIQTINQLYDIYGETKGHVIAGGFATIFAFHTNDNASRDYISGLFGKNVVEYESLGLDGGSEKRVREGFTVESWNQTNLQPGEAIIGLADEEVPFFFKFQRYEK